MKRGIKELVYRVRFVAVLTLLFLSIQAVAITSHRNIKHHSEHRNYQTCSSTRSSAPLCPILTTSKRSLGAKVLLPNLTSLIYLVNISRHDTHSPSRQASTKRVAPNIFQTQSSIHPRPNQGLHSSLRAEPRHSSPRYPRAVQSLRV